MDLHGRLLLCSENNVHNTFRIIGMMTHSNGSVSSEDPFNDWGGGRGCNKIVPVLEGDGTKIAPTGDIFDLPRGGMISIRDKLADHVGDHVVLSPEGAVLVASPGRESSYPRPPQLLSNSEFDVIIRIVVLILCS